MVVVVVVVGAGAFSGSVSPAVLPAVAPSTTAARVLDGAALSAASAVVGSVVFVVFAGTPTLANVGSTANNAMSVLLAAAVVVVCGVGSVAGSVAPPAFLDGPALLALQPILRFSIVPQ